MADQRISNFVRWFASSQHVASQWGASSDDWINDAERASRCDDAAESGCDGSTHAERIQDQRDAFSAWISDHKHDYPLFVAAVEAVYDDIESWHEKNGSLNQEIG